MATAVGAQPIDPTKGARYPILISEQVLREDRPKKKQRVSVKCNHRPKLSEPSKTTITPGSDNNYSLSISNPEKGEYKYKGSQISTSTTSLIYDPVEKSFTLDKIDAEFRFNLRSTPVQKDVSSQYPQLDTGRGKEGQDEDDLFDEGSDEDGNSEDAAPDPKNPYDYRHFLHKSGRSPSPPPSYATSPVPHHVFNSSPALSASSPRRQPAPAPTPARQSRLKRRTHERPRYLSPAAKPTREEPDADNEYSDPNELVIDMGDSAPTNQSRPWRSALGVLNEGGRSSGPISLRSAASSMSPSIRGGSPSDDGKEEQQEEEEQGSDVDADDDVEEIDLGTSAVPAPAPAPVEEVVTPGNGWDDMDNDMELEIAQALEDQAKSDMEEMAGVVATNGVNGASHAMIESSEESEEE